MASNNTTAIDQVVAPEAVEQFIALKVQGKELRTELSALLQVAINLNAALGGSTPATFNKNLQASTAATDKIIANNNRQIENEAKKAAKQEEIYNKYLVMLSKQEAARQQADAKEIQQAEAKAAKLEAIARRKANTQFPTGSGQPYNPVTSDDSPAVRYEPIITGNENMAITANKSAEAIAAENTALAEQAEVLAGLSVAQRANLELLLALQAERAENAVELRELNVQGAASGERLIFLTQRQLELAISIRETNSVLASQTKQMLAADTSMKKLDASVLLLRNSYEQLSVVERESVQGRAMLAELDALDAQNKKLALSTGNTSKQIGDYKKAQEGATTATVLADKVSAQFVRSLIRMSVQFAIITLAFGAIEWLYKYIAALNIFNPVATEAEQRQRGLVEAFSSSQYTTAIENVEKLRVNLDLAQRGFADSDTVINEYNSTIGKTVGFVDTLNQAQKGFVDFAPIYIDMVTKEAAAQLILADNAKLAAETEVKNQELREKIALTNQGKQKLFGITYSPVIQNKAIRDRRAKQEQDEIDENYKRLALAQKNGDAAAEALLKGRNDDQKKLGIKQGMQTGGSDSADPIAILRNGISNDYLERQKLQAQKLINDEKQSYATRLKATQDFYEASYRIADNNEKLATNGIKLSELQKTKIVQDFNNNVIGFQNTRDATLKSLRDKQYKQDETILKNDIEKQRNIAKGVIEDPNISYKAKLAQLDIYQSRSLELIKKTNEEEIKEAGKNTESIKIANQNKANSTDELNNEVAKKKDELAKQELEKHKKLLEAIVTADKEAQQQQLEDLDQGAIIANQVLDKQKNKLINDRATQYAEGKISEKEYNEAILDINDAYNIKRIADEITVQKAILAIREATRDKELSEAKANGATPVELDKITSDANKGITPVKNKLGDLGISLDDAITKRDNDGTKSGKADKKQTADDKRKELLTILDFAKTTTDEINKLVDAGYQNQISKLERIGQQINENAQIEKDAVSRSLDTQSNKARALAVIDAQTASQQKAIQQQIAAEKTKQARADKVAAIAKIILETAVAVVTALATPVIGPFLAAAAGAAGAVQLAIAVATPIPQFYKGTPIGGHKGGLAWYGERGRELVEEPGRQPYYSPGVATLVNLPKGTKVTPNNMLPVTPEWTSNRSDNRDVVSAIDRLYGKEQPRQTQPRLQGWVEAQRQADAWNAYSGRHFK